MRFYQSNQMARVLTAGVWTAILAVRVVEAVVHHHVRDRFLFVVTLLTVFATVVPLTTYYEFQADALVRHLLFRRTVVPLDDITLVEPYRRDSGKTVGEYLQIHRRAGKPMMALIDKRAAFLEMLEERAPGAVIRA